MNDQTPNKQKYKRTHYFSFDPSEWIEIFLMDDKEAGKLFKSIVLQLTKNDVPEDSLAFQMFLRTEYYRQKQREKANKRWGNEDGGNPPQVPPQTPPMSPMPQQQRRLKPPSLSDVYDFCDAERISPTTGREWYEWQCNKGWNSIKTQWQVALRAFAKKHENGD